MTDKKRWIKGLLFCAAVFCAAYFLVPERGFFNIKREGIFENAFTLDVKNVDAPVVKEQKLVALTFDDGPHPIFTKRLLDGLKKRNVKVTFFLIGASIDGNEEIVRQMKEDGHLIGNHSHTHVQLTAEDTQKACEEIDMTNRKIFEITGEYPTYIRPPYGSWSEELECMVPMTVVLWDIDPLDWKYQSSKRVTKHILKYVEDNSIILLHDVYGSSVDAALEVIDTLTAQGYTFVTVDELLID
ncbi:MAG: polysaccharide deacetylase family protein [Clostridiaceae bacterium]|nr:polysaccharide deacetylase family protein [Clostridiaceae bacterium]